MSGEVFVEGLRFDTIVGIRPRERYVPQPVVIDFSMGIDTRAAATSGDLSASVSYSDAAAAVQRLVQTERFELLETLAERCATLLLDTYPVTHVAFTVRKPMAVAAAEAVGVRIQRSR